VTVPHDFDAGPVAQPYAELVRDYPGDDIYPTHDFRTEWGPIFHRGRLDGTARVLVIGQDPAASENITRRILVGEAGHRVQGLLAKLGIDHSYVMVNTFLYSVYGQQAGSGHRGDAAIVAYRNRWLDALVADNPLEAVIALGSLADDAWKKWRDHAGPGAPQLAYAHVTHPTQPESSSGGDPHKLADATRAMLTNWNHGLSRLHPAITTPDTARQLVPYGDKLTGKDRAAIPERDLPPGLPDWMRSPRAWAQRTGQSAAEKRRTVTITIPSGA
jgi:uracil-DNA glycosylase